MKMQKIIALSLIAVLLSPFFINAQGSDSGMLRVLSSYYDIKNALVTGNASGASANADELVKKINQADLKTLPVAKQKNVQVILTKLLSDAGAVSTEKSINRQRELFAVLSGTMMSLAKEVKLSTEPVYVDYCPMKKSYWLSAEQPIKNPYYGSSMLTCGKITDTLK